MHANRFCLRGTDADLEYALNAVNQGVTSLGIKGMFVFGSFEDENLTCLCSHKRHCPCDREEVIVTPHRLRIVIEG